MVSLLEASTLRKPHIRVKSRVWSCSSLYRTIYGMYWRIGYGYSPKEAYEDWRKQQ